jgi:hypothetical protein
MEILTVAGYVRDPVRELWFSRHRRRAFSYEALSDHDSRWLERKLLDDVPEGEFRFYRNTSNLKACIEILNQLGLGDLKPVLVKASLSLKRITLPSNSYNSVPI